MKKLWWIVTATVSILLILFSVFRYHTLNKDVASNTQKEQLYDMGDNIQLNGLELTVNKVSKQEQKDKEAIAYLIDITLKNISTETIDKHLMNYKLNAGVYSTAQDLEMFKVQNEKNDLSNTQIEPNEVQNGELVFLIPKEKFEKHKAFRLVIPKDTYSNMKSHIVIPLKEI